MTEGVMARQRGMQNMQRDIRWTSKSNNFNVVTLGKALAKLSLQFLCSSIAYSQYYCYPAVPIMMTSIYFWLLDQRLNIILSMMKVALFILLVFIATASYDPVFGEKLCRLTVASYCRKAEVQKWSCTPCKNSPINLTNVLTFQNSTKDTLGYIGTSTQHDAIVLVFRGTLPWDIKNWISDINFVAVNYPLCNNLCKVHRGFYYAFLDIQKQVLSAVANYRTKYGHQNIIVTGHSLGAALATHATAHLMANKYKVTQFYNFGSPRVGDTKFTAWFNDLYGVSRFKARVTHHRDPVPHLPFQDWGFKHVNTEVFYKGKVGAGYVVCNDAQAEDKSCSDQYKLDTSTLDHVSYYGIDFTAIVLACQI